jgi:hypothetical protein
VLSQKILERALLEPDFVIKIQRATLMVGVRTTEARVAGSRPINSTWAANMFVLYCRILDNFSFATLAFLV